ncbi:hypothetical protein LZ32DRAFT_607572 [Colletotrichum eremochloae]|nr:hypothetical protein LZ32DRAFT_607572 [Colletotrichum eremochloae]
MAHDQLRTQLSYKIGETAGRAHVDGDFTNHPIDHLTPQPPAEPGGNYVQHDISYMGEHTRDGEFDAFEAGFNLTLDLSANSPSQFLPPASDEQDTYAEFNPFEAEFSLALNLSAHLPSQDPPQSLNIPEDPCQAWEIVKGKLHTIRNPRDALAVTGVPLVPTLHVTLGSTTTPSQDTHSGSNAFQLSARPTVPSSVTSNSSRFELCCVCGVPVNTRLMERHHQDRHRQKGAPQYTCKCGHKSPAMRKANHTRHLETCKAKDTSSQFFVCRCGNKSGSLPAHQDHIKDCGKKRAGRRPKGAQTAN